MDRFPTELERAYQDDLVEQKRRTTREGGLLAIALFSLFAVLDVWSIPSAVEWVLAIRFGGVVPLLLIIVWWSGQPSFPRLYGPLMILMFMGMGLAIEVMVWLARSGELANTTYYAGLILVVIALYAWSYLPILATAAIGFSLVGIYLAIALVGPGSPAASDAIVVMSNLFFFVAANLVGLYGLRARDRTLRENYLLRQSLHEARIEAERLAHVKSEFLANMSHEIRTPLNGVLGLAQLGHRESAGRGKSQDYFDRILHSGRLLLAIINDILDFSKIEAGKLTIESVPFAPRRLIDDTLTVVADMADAKGLRLETRLEPTLPEVCLGDPTRLSQILLNLLSNAVKFTEHGGITLTADGRGETLVFSVVDTGIGLTPEQIQRLFTPFEQADSGTTRQYGGTGLGLAISQRLAELMGGRIQVESQLGEGARFTVELPHVAAAGPLETPTAGRRPTPMASKRLTGVHLLIAEDNAINQQVLKEILSLEGAALTLVDNGWRAVEAVARLPEAFDLVLMDVQMPEMDGREATRRIAALAPGLPVIGQTAHALAEEHAQCLAAGMVDTLTKPLDHERLVNLIRTHLQSRSPEQPALKTFDSPTDLDPEQRLRRSYGHCRLLLVEDNPINQEIALALLCEGPGLRVDVADHGQRAIELARTEVYDLILMDMRMPVMDGTTAVAVIRQLPGYDLTPILALTASDLAEDIQSCFEAGMNDHLTKPIEPDMLYRALLRWLPRQARPVQ